MAEYKCPCCDAAITFDAHSQKLKCLYCENEFDIQTIQGYTDAKNADSEDNMHWDTKASEQWTPGEEEGMRVYVCQACGGEIVADETTGATSCPYCGNPLVMKGIFAGDLKPDLVIPFRFSREDAKKKLAEYYKGKKLLPKSFASSAHIDEIKGCYVPFWLFNADAEAHIRMKGTRIRTWSDSNYDYTETSFYSVLRGGFLSFSDVPVDGSKKMADDMMESVEPFDASQSQQFTPDYLAGFIASRYDVSSEESIDRANKRIKDSTQAAFTATAEGYASLSIENSSIRLFNGTSRYALFPVWILNTTWQGQNYYFAMNGQTGKFTGNLPMDKSLYWGWVFKLLPITAAISGLIVWIIGRMLG